MNSQLARFKEAVSKLLFCVQHAATTTTLLRLVLHTKRLRFNHTKTPVGIAGEKPQRYDLRLHGLKVPVHLRTYSGDILIFFEVFWRQVYACPSAQFASCKTIIDVGGNVGMSALFFALHAPAAHLYVLEPDAHNLSVLQLNLQSFKERVTILPVAAASISGMVYLSRSRFAYNSVIANAGEVVAALSLNSLVKTNNLQHIDLIKIDIEGYEENLFAGATEWLSITRQVLIEIHSEKAFGICASALAAYGFAMQLCHGQQDAAGIYYACKKVKWLLK